MAFILMRNMKHLRRVIFTTRYSLSRLDVQTVHEPMRHPSTAHLPSALHFYSTKAQETDTFEHHNAKLLRARNSKALLDAIDKRKLTDDECVLLLKKIIDIDANKNNNLNGNQLAIEQTARDDLNSYVHSLSPRLLEASPRILISALHNLLQLNTKSSTLVRDIEKKLNSQVGYSSLTIKELCKMAASYQPFTTVSTQQDRAEVFHRILDSIRSRCDEIDNLKDGIMLLYFMGDKVANTSRKETSHPEREMDLKFVKALQLKSCALLTQMNNKQFYRLVHSLGRLSHFNIPSRHILASILCDIEHIDNKDFTLQQLAHIFEAMSKLRIRDTNTLSVLGEWTYHHIQDYFLLNRKASIDNEANLAGLAANLQSISLSHYSTLLDHAKSLDAISQSAMTIALNDSPYSALKKKSEIRFPLLQNVLHTCARLSYTPKCLLKSDNTLQSLHATLLDLHRTDQSVNLRLWVQTVWSLVILGCESSELLESVLSQSFIGKLKTDSCWNAVPVSLKLLDIQNHAELLSKSREYTGPLLDTNTKQFLILHVPMGQSTLVHNVLNVLNVMSAGTGFVKKQHLTDDGIPVDFEVLVNQNLRMLNFDDFSDSLPDNVERISIVVQYSSHCTKVQKKPIGVKRLHIEHLKAKGHAVATIEQESFYQCNSMAKKTEYIKNCITTSLQEKK